jgi:hypothetical protein
MAHNSKKSIALSSFLYQKNRIADIHTNLLDEYKTKYNNIFSNMPTMGKGGMVSMSAAAAAATATTATTTARADVRAKSREGARVSPEPTEVVDVFRNNNNNDITCLESQVTELSTYNKRLESQVAELFTENKHLDFRVGELSNQINSMLSSNLYSSNGLSTQYTIVSNALTINHSPTSNVFFFPLGIDTINILTINNIQTNSNCMYKYTFYMKREPYQPNSSYIQISNIVLGGTGTGGENENVIIPLVGKIIRPSVNSTFIIQEFFIFSYCFRWSGFQKMDEL